MPSINGTGDPICKVDDMTAFRSGILSDSHMVPGRLQILAYRWMVFIFISVLGVSITVNQGISSPPFLNGAYAVIASAQSQAEGLGAQIYKGKCAGCHGKKGEGSPNLFPSLAGDPVVTEKDPHDHIQTVLFGRHGAIIGGVTYTVYMPAWAGQLSDEEVAAVINHERTSWGNNAPTVTPSEVAKVRAEGPP